MPDNLKNISENRQVRHEYYVIESQEAGIELFGTEVKSLRAGGVNLKDSWIAIENGQAYVKAMQISPYEKGNIFNRDPTRDRRLLLHKKEIMRLYNTVKRDGLTLVPLSIYFKGSNVKVQVALCKGKQTHDKRDSMAIKTAKRDIDRAMKEKTHRGDY